MTNFRCAFSARDCTVSVDYVANECNGLPHCHISLDAQYLHSCKAYSDYLFIVHECVARAATLDVCESRLVRSGGGGGDHTLYLHSPNYPAEYESGRDCACSLQAAAPAQLQLLEFDLESSFDGAPTACTKDFLQVGFFYLNILSFFFFIF